MQEDFSKKSNIELIRAFQAQQLTVEGAKELINRYFEKKLSDEEKAALDYDENFLLEVERNADNECATNPEIIYIALIEDYLEGRLTGKNKDDFEALLAQDEEFRKYVELQKTIPDSIAEVNREKIERALWLLNKIKRGEEDDNELDFPFTIG